MACEEHARLVGVEGQAAAEKLVRDFMQWRGGRDQPGQPFGPGGPQAASLLAGQTWLSGPGGFDPREALAEDFTLVLPVTPYRAEVGVSSRPCPLEQRSLFSAKPFLKSLALL